MSSRLIANRAAVRRSRSRAESASARTLSVSRLTTRPTTSITPKVTTYRASTTRKCDRAATKKKSNAATLATAATIEGPSARRRRAAEDDEQEDHIAWSTSWKT